MKLALVLMVALTLPAFAQSSSNAEVFSSKDVQAKLADLVAISKKAPSGSASSVLGGYKTHSLRLVTRTANGGAEVHGHYDDIMIVISGTATLITGGTVVDGHEGKDGEVAGTSIKDGKTQTISAGDIIHVPAGTPHQMLVSPGTEFTAFVAKVRED